MNEHTKMKQYFPYLSLGLHIICASHQKVIDYLLIIKLTIHNEYGLFCTKRVSNEVLS